MKLLTIRWYQKRMHSWSRICWPWDCQEDNSKPCMPREWNFQPYSVNQRVFNGVKFIGRRVHNQVWGLLTSSSRRLHCIVKSYRHKSAWSKTLNHCSLPGAAKAAIPTIVAWKNGVLYHVLLCLSLGVETDAEDGLCASLRTATSLESSWEDILNWREVSRNFNFTILTEKYIKQLAMVSINFVDNIHPAFISTDPVYKSYSMVIPITATTITCFHCLIARRWINEWILIEPNPFQAIKCKWHGNCYGECPREWGF